MNASSSDSAPAKPARAWSISPTTTPGPVHRSPAANGKRPSSARSNVVFPLPLGPTIATRSPQPISRSTGPSVKLPRVTTAPCMRMTTSPLRGAFATWKRRSQPSHGFSTDSRRASARSVIFAFAACFSDVATLNRRMFLSFSVVSRFALLAPWTDHSRCVRARCSRRARSDRKLA